MNKFYIVVFNKRDRYMVNETDYKRIKGAFSRREDCFFIKIGEKRDSEIGMKWSEIHHLEIFECDEPPGVQ